MPSNYLKPHPVNWTNGQCRGAKRLLLGTGLSYVEDVLATH